MIKPLNILLCILLLSLSTGCVGDKIPQTDPELPADHWFELTIGKTPIRVQLAITEQEMRRGLMQRKELGENDGMIFIYPAPRKMSFWMKNTPLPLSIGYFDEAGILREVYPLYPFDESPVPSQSSRIQFALEMNQGWFSKNGIRQGTAIDLRLLSAALKARGFDPADFGLSKPESDSGG